MRKSPRNRHKAPLLPIPVQDAFDRLACDIIGPFPPSKLGNRYVVVFSEYLTKWVEAFPVSSIEASVIAHLLVDEIFARHGAPRTLLSDRGSNSLYSIVTEVCRLLNAKKVHTTAYLPQTDGLVERFNNTLAEAISPGLGHLYCCNFIRLSHVSLRLHRRYPFLFVVWSPTAFGTWCEFIATFSTLFIGWRTSCTHRKSIRDSSVNDTMKHR